MIETVRLHHHLAIVGTCELERRQQGTAAGRAGHRAALCHAELQSDHGDVDEMASLVNSLCNETKQRHLHYNLVGWMLLVQRYKTDSQCLTSHNA